MENKKVVFGALVWILSLLTFEISYSQTQPKAWYVYKYATGLNNGTSWQNAWTSFSAINWSSMQVGDTLYISGGSDSLIYSESMTPAKKGITITKGKSTGHNGRVIIKAPTVASGIGIHISNVDSIKVIGLEFQDWFTCVRFYSNVTNGITFGMMKDCKGRTAGWVTEGLNGNGSDTANIRVKNLWYINNDFTTVNNSSYQTEFGSFGAVWNVFFIGNKFINYNNNSATHDDFVQGNYNTNFYYINNFFRHDSSVTKEGNANGLAGISNGGGDWYFINNILVEPPTSIGYPIMMFYRPVSNPSSYSRNWAKIRIINNTLAAAHVGMIRIGYDEQAFIANNIFYTSQERILVSNSGAGRNSFITPDNCEISNQYFTIQNNGFYNNYTDAANPNGKVYPYLGCDNPPTLPASNKMFNRGSNTFYLPFNSNFRMASLNPLDFKIPANSSAKDIGQQISDLTMHPSTGSIIDPEYGTPLSNYRGSGKNLVQYFVERDFEGNLRVGNWDIGAFEYGGSQVIIDNDPPEVLSAEIIDSVTVSISFSEPLDQSSATNPNNFSIDNGVSVNNAQLVNLSNVRLTTSVHSPGFYTVTVNNVTDTAGNVISSSNNSADYGYNPDPTPGLLKFTPTGTNASSIPEPEHLPEKTFDGLGYNSGDPTSRWAGNNLPQWIGYDLGNSIMLNKTRIQFYKWNEGRIYTYSIMVSTDSINWTSVKQNILSSNTEWTEENFEPVPARYIRIIVHSNNQNDWASLWETEFYGQLIVSGNENNNVKPTDFSLEQNFPNPFNPSTKIIWQSPVGSHQTIKVFDILGNEIATLVDEYKEPGRYEVEFDASNLSSGIYIYRLQTEGYISTRKMILLR